MEAQNDHDLSVVSLLIKGKIGVRSPLFQLRRMVKSFNDGEGLVGPAV